MTTVPRKTTRAKAPAKGFDPTKLAKVFAEFRELKNIEAQAKEQAETLRKEELLPALEAHGEPHGEKGQHRAIELPEEIDGFVRLVRRANKSTFVNIDRAEALLDKKGVLPEAQVVSVTITGVPATMLLALEAELAKGKWAKLGVIPDVQINFSQDAMMALFQRHRQELTELEESGKRVSARERARFLTEKELDSLMDTEVAYSFHPEKS